MTVTDAWRALAADWAVDSGTLRNALEDAANALDAARAERDEVKGLLDDKSRRDDTALMAYKREKHRAEAAEARIAAALDVAGHDFYQSEAQRLARDVRRALTEGTGQ